LPKCEIGFIESNWVFSYLRPSAIGSPPTTRNSSRSQFTETLKNDEIDRSLAAARKLPVAFALTPGQGVEVWYKINCRDIEILAGQLTSL
jgi:hypothetical protein